MKTLSKSCAVGAACPGVHDPEDGSGEEPCTEDLAIAAFEANERVKGLMIMNSPTDYEERKKAAIELAVAREAAFYAQQKLDARLRGE